MTLMLKNFARGLFMQLHVIHALILRETRTRFGKHSLGYVWALMDPLLFIGLFWAMFELAGRNVPSGMDALGFLCTGFLPYNVFSCNLSRAQTAVASNLALLYYPQVHPLDLVAARSILETVTLTVAFFLFMLLNTLITQHFPLDSALKTLSGLALAAALGTALGLLFNSIILVVPTFEHFTGPILRPMFWISGLFFSTNELPYSVREMFLWNPMLHIIEVTRDGWFQSYDYHYYSYGYIMLWILGLGVAGLVAERLTRKYTLVS